MWSPDSKWESFLVILYRSNFTPRCFITTSRDMTARLYTLDPVQDFRPKTFAGHKGAVLGAYFSSDAKTASMEGLKRGRNDLILFRYTPSAKMVQCLHGMRRTRRV